MREEIIEEEIIEDECEEPPKAPVIMNDLKAILAAKQAVSYRRPQSQRKTHNDLIMNVNGMYTYNYQNDTIF
jgi:hypothetical protein